MNIAPELDGPEHADGYPAESWFADCLERLFGEFEDRHPLRQIAAVTRRCLEDLKGSERPGALPELVERLARHRLERADPL